MFRGLIVAIGPMFSKHINSSGKILYLLTQRYTKALLRSAKCAKGDEKHKSVTRLSWNKITSSNICFFKFEVRSVFVN